MFKKLIVTLLLLPLLTGCAAYNSGFSCGDAKGVPCTPMERVDLLISSGEIENYVSGEKRCRGRACRKQQQDDSVVKALLQDKSKQETENKNN